MKHPIPPPGLDEIARQIATSDGAQPRFLDILEAEFGTEINGRYLHWDNLRHRDPPSGFTTREWWYGIAQARRSSRKKLPLVSIEGGAFGYVVTDTLWERLHKIDQRASGAIEAPEPVTNEDTRDRYMVSTLIEEAITSSQLEGASTTLRVAKQMLRSGRDPVDRSEQMIFNNYRAMQFVRQYRRDDLTPEIVLELHRIVTDKTLDDPGAAGRWRTSTEDVVVHDSRDNTTLHVPPHASQIPERVRRMCDFANNSDDEYFIHPVVRSVVLHFMLAYDHPFVDGNGRTARALFYWSMARQRYWLMEFASISRLLLKAPAKYARAFLHCETDSNDTTYFLLHQTQLIIRALDALQRYLQQKVEEQRRIELLLRGPDGLQESLNYRQIALLSRAQREPSTMFTIESHKRSHNVTYQTARTDLLALEEIGLLRKRKISRAFVFYAPDDLESQVARIQKALA